MTQALASDICIQIDELLPEYALGLLEPDEQAWSLPIWPDVRIKAASSPLWMRPSA